MPLANRGAQQPAPPSQTEAPTGAFTVLGGGPDDVWGCAPYQQFSVLHRDAIAHLMRVMPAARRQRWLDIGTGTGEVALPAALAGAHVTACDLSPGMIEAARKRAAGLGLDIALDIADAQALPYPDASFDVVTAAFTVNLIPGHAAVASELARVCRRGGTLGLVTVFPDRGQAEVFEAMLRYLPPLPPGGPDPYAWADRGYLDRLLAPAFELSFEEGDAPQTGESGDAMWDLMARTYGPAHRLVATLDQDKKAALAKDVASVYDRYRTPAGPVSMPRPYLIVAGTRR